MTRIYERRHAHLQGAIVAIITEHAPQHFSIILRIFGSDGREQVIAGGTTHESLAEAQRHASDTQTNLRDAQDAADEQVRQLGHPECSAACAPWPTDTTD